MCTGMIARVRDVTRDATCPPSMHQVIGSESTSTGVAPARTMASAHEMIVKVGMITSSPGLEVERFDRELERRGAARDCDAMCALAVRRPRLLELVAFRPCRRNPSRLQRFDHGVDLRAADAWLTHRNARQIAHQNSTFSAWPADGPCFTSSSTASSRIR